MDQGSTDVNGTVTKPKPRFIVVDFFCGAGGTTSGLIDAGCYVIAGIDKDDRCEDTYVKNNMNERGDKAGVVYLNRDIFTRSLDHPGGQQEEVFEALGPLIEAARERMQGVPLLFAICAPCQPFTSLSRKTLSEERAAARTRDRSLLLESLKFIKHYKPDAILSENVAGIDDPKYGGVWDDFRTGLEKLGFATGEREVDASRFGVAQHRIRRILAATKRPEGIADSVKLELPDSDGREKPRTVAEAIGHLPAIAAGTRHDKVKNHWSSSLSELNLKRIRMAKPGQPNFYMKGEGEDLSLECHRKAREKGGKGSFSHVYTRLDGGAPAPTLTTKFTSISNGRYGHYDMGQDRGLSVREGALIQSFRDGYEFHHGCITVQARMVGNAVPPALAEFFGGWLADVTEGARREAFVTSVERASRTSPVKARRSRSSATGDLFPSH